MKKDTHPKYKQVLFVDSASGYKFVCGSTIKTDATETHEGVEYPVVYLSTSSASHPFFTGSKQLVDSEGRVQKFNKRFGKGFAQTEVQAAPQISAEAIAEAQALARAQEKGQNEKKAEKRAGKKGGAVRERKAAASGTAKPAAKGGAKPAAAKPKK